MITDWYVPNLPPMGTHTGLGVAAGAGLGLGLPSGRVSGGTVFRGGFCTAQATPPGMGCLRVR